MLESYLKKNKHISQRITGINIVAGVSGMSYRSDGGWNEVKSKIEEAQKLHDSGMEAHSKGNHKESEELLNKALELFKG